MMTIALQSGSNSHILDLIAPGIEFCCLRVNLRREARKAKEEEEEGTKNRNSDAMEDSHHRMHRIQIFLSLPQNGGEGRMIQS